MENEKLRMRVMVTRIHYCLINLKEKDFAKRNIDSGDLVEITGKKMDGWTPNCWEVNDLGKTHEPVVAWDVY